MATPALQEDSETLEPVKLGPARVRGLWNAIDSHFGVPENWEQVEKKAWIQAVRAGTPARQRTKVYSIDQFIGNIRLRGLLDEIEINFEQTLRRVGTEATRKRSLQLTIDMKGRPEVAVIGDPDWISAVENTLRTMFENERSKARTKRTVALLAPILCLVVISVAVEVRYGFAVAFLFGVFFVMMAFIILANAVPWAIPDSRVWVDEETGSPSLLYTWAEQILISVASGVAVAALLWAFQFI